MMKSLTSMLAAVAVAGAVGLMTGCGSTSPVLTRNESNTLKIEGDQAQREFLNADPGLDRFFNGAYGYAIFPNIGEGGFVLGGAHGDGLVYQGGRLIGTADISKGTVGAQIGGTNFSQVVFFQNESAFRDFIDGKFALDASAKAVAAKSGASTAVDYEKGVAVFTNTKGGAMLQASVGGQKFRFRPIGDSNTPTGAPAHDPNRTATDRP